MANDNEGEIIFKLRYTDTLEEKVRSLITQAVGVGSTCWAHLEGAGVFQDQRAIEVADAAYEALQLLLNFEPKLGAGCMICNDPDDHNGEPHSWAVGGELTS